jgi:hypothetical protein
LVASSTLVRDVIPAFDLQRYVTKYKLIVTTLLIDRYWAFRFRVARNIFLASIPNRHHV